MKRVLLIVMVLMVGIGAMGQDDHEVIMKDIKFSGQIEFVTKSKKIQGNPIWKYKEGTFWYLTNMIVGDDCYVDFYIETPDGLHREVMSWKKNDAFIVVLDQKEKPTYVVMNSEHSFLTIMPGKDEKYVIQIVTQ